MRMIRFRRQCAEQLVTSVGLEYSSRRMITVLEYNTCLCELHRKLQCAGENRIQAKKRKICIQHVKQSASRGVVDQCRYLLEYITSRDHPSEQPLFYPSARYALFRSSDWAGPNGAKLSVVQPFWTIPNRRRQAHI